MEFSAQWTRDNASWIAGIDEAGRGPLAGPVVAAAVVLDIKYPISGLKDSKKLSERQRLYLKEQIERSALAIGIGMVDAAHIDEINILRGALLAMAMAYEQANKQLGGQLRYAFIDGNQKAPLPPDVLQYTWVRGDTFCEPIMAASIIAKTTRDSLMREYAKLYPEYGFEKHKGYPTQAHKQALLLQGACPIHRKTFACVLSPSQALQR